MLSFSEHRQLYMVEMSQQIGEVDFNFTKHFLERMKVRLGNTTMSSEEMIEYLKPILANMVKKLGELPVVGEFLFYSKKLGHGIVAAWDAYKRKMSLITFLPKERHQPTKGTQEVVIESVTYTLIEID